MSEKIADGEERREERREDDPEHELASERSKSRIAEDYPVEEFDPTKKYHKKTGSIYLICCIYSFGAFFFGYGQAVTSIIQNNMLYAFGNYWAPTNTPDHPVEDATDEACIDYITLSPPCNTKKPNNKDACGCALQDTVAPQQSLMGAAGPVGCVIGAAVAGILLSKTTPKLSMIICDGIAIGGTAIMCIPYLSLFIIARIINGFSIGISSATIPVINNQISPQKISGMVGMIFSIFINVGIFVTSLFGYGMDLNDPKGGYYYILPIAFPGVVALARLIALLTCYRKETPRYYLQKNDEEKAREYLAWIYEPEYVEMMLDIEKTNYQVEVESARKKQNVCGARYGKRLALGCLLMVLQQLSGINAVIFYSSVIFEAAADGNTTIQNVLVNISGLLTIVTCFIGGAFTKCYGRKTILWFGDLICLLSLFVLFILAYPTVLATNEKIINIIIVILIYFYQLGFGTSLGPIIWLHNAEILPVEGVAVTTLTNWVFVIVVVFTFPLMKDSWGIHWCFFIYGVCCTAGIFLIIFMCKETRGKTFKEIDEEWYPAQYRRRDEWFEKMFGDEANQEDEDGKKNEEDEGRIEGRDEEGHVLAD